MGRRERGGDGDWDCAQYDPCRGEGVVTVRPRSEAGRGADSGTHPSRGWWAETFDRDRAATARSPGGARGTGDPRGPDVATTVDVQEHHTVGRGAGGARPPRERAHRGQPAARVGLQSAGDLEDA